MGLAIGQAPAVFSQLHHCLAQDAEAPELVLLVVSVISASSGQWLPGGAMRRVSWRGG